MSVSGEALAQEFDKLREAKDLWLERHIDYRRRVERTDKALAGVVAQTREGVESTSKQRAALRARLRQLQERGVALAEMALERDHEQLRAAIDTVAEHLDKLRWKEADEAIDAADALITAGRQRLEAIEQLNRRCDGLSTVLGRLGRVEDLDVVAPLIDRLSDVRRLLAPPTLDATAARTQLASLENDVTPARALIEGRRSRLQQLHVERKVLLADLRALEQRATVADAGPALLRALADAISSLDALARGDDPAALERAHRTADDARPTLASGVEAAEQAHELRTRRELLPLLAQELEGLQTAFEARKSEALPILVASLDEIEDRAALLIADEKSADVDGIQKALAELKSQQDHVAREMPGVRRERKRMRRALDAYDQYLVSPPESRAWPDLEDAYRELPAAIRQRKDPAFDDSPAWVAEGMKQNADVDEFLRVFVIVEAQDKGTSEREAYVDAQDARDDRLEALKPLRRHATPAQLTEIDRLFTELEDWLDDDEIDRLDDGASTEVEQRLEALKTKQSEIDAGRKKAKGEAEFKDSRDGGHSVQRHGPEVDDEALQKRLKTGRAPGGVFSPTRKSSRFLSYAEWEATRAAAFVEAQRRVGFDMGVNFDQFGQPGPGVFELDHGRPIGEGFQGVGGGTYVNSPGGQGSGGLVYTVFAPMPALTHTKSTIEWDAKARRWVAVQHFPID